MFHSAYTTMAFSLNRPRTYGQGVFLNWRKLFFMYIMSTPYTICDYLSRKGPCGKRCFGGRCRTHRKSESLTPCRNGCGKGTASISGFCAHVETCGWRQNDELARMRERARKPSPAQEPAVTLIPINWYNIQEIFINFLNWINFSSQRNKF